MAVVIVCSFCRKSQYQVRRLVAGPDVHICDECVELAHRIIEHGNSPPPGSSVWVRALAWGRRVLSDIRSVSRSSGPREPLHH